MKREVLLILSILFPGFIVSANEGKPAESSKETIEKSIKEKSLHEKLSEKGRVTTKETADGGGRTTGGGRTSKVGK